MFMAVKRIFDKLLSNFSIIRLTGSNLDVIRLTGSNQYNTVDRF